MTVAYVLYGKHIRALQGLSLWSWVMQVCYSDRCVVREAHQGVLFRGWRARGPFCKHPDHARRPQPEIQNGGQLLFLNCFACLQDPHHALQIKAVLCVCYSQGHREVFTVLNSVPQLTAPTQDISQTKRLSCCDHHRRGAGQKSAIFCQLPALAQQHPSMDAQHRPLRHTNSYSCRTFLSVVRV